MDEKKGEMIIITFLLLDKEDKDMEKITILL